MAIHDRLAAVIEALWSHLLVTAAQCLALGWIWVSVVQEAVNPPNDQRGAHAVAVEGSGVRQPYRDHVGKLGGVT